MHFHHEHLHLLAQLDLDELSEKNQGLLSVYLEKLAQHYRHCSQIEVADLMTQMSKDLSSTSLDRVELKNWVGVVMSKNSLVFAVDHVVDLDRRSFVRPYCVEKGDH